MSRVRELHHPILVEEVEGSAPTRIPLIICSGKNKNYTFYSSAYKGVDYVRYCSSITSVVSTRYKESHCLSLYRGVRMPALCRLY